MEQMYVTKTMIKSEVQRINKTEILPEIPMNTFYFQFC